MAKKPRKLNVGGGTGKVSAMMGTDAPSAKHDWFIVDDETLKNPIIKDQVYCPTINGEIKGHGLIKRNWATYPEQMFGALPSTIKVFTRSEVSERIKEHDKEQSSLWHIRQRCGPNGGRMSSLDQNGQGYCWMYSVTKALMYIRGKRRLPYVLLSAHAGACKVKNFRDEGGWCGLAAQFLRQYGQPSVEFWPEKSMSRSHDKPETWADALKYKLDAEYADLTRAVYDQNMTHDQIFTCLALNQPVALDYNEMSHSMCGIRVVEVEAGSLAPEVDNSWTDNWGNQGCGVIRASWTVDGAIAVLDVPASL